jgi:hypothetical protein
MWRKQGIAATTSGFSPGGRAGWMQAGEPERLRQPASRFVACFMFFSSRLCAARHANFK